MEITIDKERAQLLGVSTEAIGSTLEIMLGGVTTTTFVENGEEYDLFLKAPDDSIITAQDLAKLYVRSHATGELIRMDNLVTTKEVGNAAQLRHYNHNRAITLSASLAVITSLAKPSLLDKAVVENLPSGDRQLQG